MLICKSIPGGRGQPVDEPQPRIHDLAGQAVAARCGFSQGSSLDPRVSVVEAARSQAGVNAFGQGLEVAHALDLVIGQFDAEMVFQTRKHFQCLQAVNSQLFEKIVFWRERLRGQLKMFGRQIEYFLGRLFERAHVSLENLSLSRKEEKSPRPGSALARLHQLETIPKRVKDVRAPAPVNLHIRLGWQPSGLAFREYLVQSLDEQCGVRLLGGTKVFLSPQVQLRCSRSEPATATSG